MLPTRNAKQAVETLNVALRDTALTAESITSSLVRGSETAGEALGFAADRHATGMETLALSIDRARAELRQASDDFSDSLRYVAAGMLFGIAAEFLMRWLDRRGE